MDAISPKVRPLSGGPCPVAGAWWRVRAATEAMNAQLLAHYHERATAWLEQSAHESSAWRSAAGFGDVMIHLTVEELAALNDRFEALFAEYEHRSTDPASRPEGARPVAVIQYAFPMDRTPNDHRPRPAHQPPAG